MKKKIFAKNNEGVFLSKMIPILYEDECCIVFQKPAGLLVIPTPKKESQTLVSIVNHQYRTEQSYKLHPAHRLDKETSGAIIFGKGKKNQQRIMELFQKGEVCKKYIAIVHGKLKNKKGVLKSYISTLDEKKFSKKVKGKFAETHYLVKRQYDSFAVVEVRTMTGRTNQIRIHFSDKGHPLLGDRKYSVSKNFKIKFRRTALHAAYLEFTGFEKNVIIQSKMPMDMEDFLNNYERRSF